MPSYNGGCLDFRHPEDALMDLKIGFDFFKQSLRIGGYNVGTHIAFADGHLSDITPNEHGGYEFYLDYPEHVHIAITLNPDGTIQGKFTDIDGDTWGTCLRSLEELDTMTIAEALGKGLREANIEIERRLSDLFSRVRARLRQTAPEPADLD